MTRTNKRLAALAATLLSLSVSAQQSGIGAQQGDAAASNKQSPSPAGQSPAASNARGIEAFSAGDYELALTEFLAVEAAGDEAESLDYNIAVSLYRLGRLEEAERRFLALQDKPRWQGLVDYNLGLLYETRGEIELARDYYSRAAAQQRHEKIQQLAAAKCEALDRIEPATAVSDTALTAEAVTVESGAKSWAALIKLGSGLDSNASSLADDLLQEADSSEDAYSELLLYSHAYVLGERGDGLRLYGLGFARQFEELDYLDSRVLGLGTVWERPLWGWQQELGLNVTRTELDSRLVADQLQISTAISKRFRPGTFKFGLSYSALAAGDAFQQVEGDRYRGEVTWSKRFERSTASLRYRKEWNNRLDLRRGGGFASYSPIRDSLRAKLDWRFTRRLRSHLTAEFVSSEYRDRNRLRDLDGSIKEVQRENRKLSLASGLSWHFTDSLRAELEYRFDDVGDEYDLYTYDKSRVQASIQLQL